MGAATGMLQDEDEVRVAAAEGRLAGEFNRYRMLAAPGNSRRRPRVGHMLAVPHACSAPCLQRPDTVGSGDSDGGDSVLREEAGASVAGGSVTPWVCQDVAAKTSLSSRRPNPWNEWQHRMRGTKMTRTEAARRYKLERRSAHGDEGPTAPSLNRESYLLETDRGLGSGSHDTVNRADEPTSPSPSVWRIWTAVCARRRRKS